MTDSDAVGARSVSGRARAVLHRNGRVLHPDAAPVPTPHQLPPAPHQLPPGPRAGRFPERAARRATPAPSTDAAPALVGDGQPATAGSGTVLAGRYRLTGPCAPVLGAQMWRAVDEVLGRDVGVVVVPGSDPRAPALLAAARRAATVADQHFLRVYDAGTCLTGSGTPLAYVVQEWVTARSLASLLAGGPLEPDRSALLTRELAEAVAAAHQQGLTHRSVTPDRVLVSANGSVRVVGLEVAAALAGLPPGGSADDRRLDVRAVGAVLYAGLTGRWPLDLRTPGTAGPAQPAADTPSGQLRPAPRRHGRVFGPRQVRPGIPRSHDLLALRALGHDAGVAGGPVVSARELAGLLGQVTDPAIDANTPLPQLRDLAAAAVHPDGPDHPRGAQTGTPTGATTGAGTQTGTGTGTRTVTPPQTQTQTQTGTMNGTGTVPGRPIPARPGDLPTSPGGPAATVARPSSASTGVTTTAVAVLASVALGLGLLAWQVSGQLSTRGTDRAVLRDARVPAAGSAAAGALSAASPAVGALLPVIALHEFDPQGADGGENPTTTGLATDGDPLTAWQTSRYSTARPGGIQGGVGLLVDLGSVRQVSRVDLGLLGRGTGVELRTAGIATDPPKDLTGFGVVATVADAGADTSLRPASPVLARYLLVWLTDLPRDGAWYRGGIRTLDVRG